MVDTGTSNCWVTLKQETCPLYGSPLAPVLPNAGLISVSFWCPQPAISQPSTNLPQPPLTMALNQCPDPKFVDQNISECAIKLTPRPLYIMILFPSNCDQRVIIQTLHNEGEKTSGFACNRIVWQHILVQHNRCCTMLRLYRESFFIPGQVIHNHLLMPAYTVLSVGILNTNGGSQHQNLCPAGLFCNNL